MSTYDSNDIQKLAELFKLGENDDSDEEREEIGRPTVKDLRPQDLREKVNAFDNGEDVVGSKTIKNRRNEELSADLDEETLRYLEDDSFKGNDWRKVPQWDIYYRQKVTSSDLFLGMGAKTPATASCENMIITVDLPREKWQNVDLKITRQRLELLSPRYRLDIPLPHPVDPQRGNAQFDSEAEKLVITLELNREFDYVNF